MCCEARYCAPCLLILSGAYRHVHLLTTCERAGESCGWETRSHHLAWPSVFLLPAEFPCESMSGGKATEGPAMPFRPVTPGWCAPLQMGCRGALSDEHDVGSGPGGMWWVEASEAAEHLAVPRTGLCHTADDQNGSGTETKKHYVPLNALFHFSLGGAS